MAIVIILTYLPIHQVRKRVKDAKIQELKRIQRAIGGEREALANCSIAADADRFGLPELLSWRQQLKELRDLPVDLHFFSEIGAHACAAALVSAGAWVFTLHG